MKGKYINALTLLDQQRSLKDRVVFYSPENHEASANWKSTSKRIFESYQSLLWGAISPYFVSTEISETIRDRSNEVPENFRLFSDMIPEPKGWIWFEDPVDIYLREEDVPGEHASIEAHHESLRAIAYEEVKSAEGYLGIAFFVVLECDQIFRQQISSFPAHSLGNTVPSLRFITHMRYNETVSRFEDRLKGEVFNGNLSAPNGISFRYLYENINFIQQMIAFFLFVTEKLFVSTPMSYTKKQLKTKKIKNQIKRFDGQMPELNVIQLRKKVYPDQGGESDSSRIYTCRWEVKQHKRMQWYPSEGVHREITVYPYTKGPEGLPLKTKQNIFAVER